MIKEMNSLSPMMRQYLKTHEEVPDAFLLYRLGDFYELFFDDAIKASKILDLTLTGRDCGMEERAPMCGVPYHAVDTYIAKLVEKGYKVAICEQTSDPAQSKGLVDREITRIITSGTVTDSKILKTDTNNYILSVYYNKLRYGAVYCDVSTGEVSAYLCDGEDADESFMNLFVSKMPSEILVNTVLYQNAEIKNKCERISNASLTPMKASYFYLEDCSEEIKKQLDIYSLSASGLGESEEVIKACGCLFMYLRETQKHSLKHINKVYFYESDDKMHLDFSTKRNLELTETIRGNHKKGSLFWALDKTVTGIGSRTLRQWINEPLKTEKEIVKRQDALSELVSDIMLIEDISGYLKQTYDIQRMCSKISYNTVNGRDLLALKETLFFLPLIKNLLNKTHSEMLIELDENISPMEDIYTLLEKAVNEDCTVNMKDGNIIKSGYDSRVDTLRELKFNAKAILTKLEQEEREKTSIKNLKVKYNKVFGYYFEVSKGNLNNVPDYFIRKQTLVNAERFYTEELKNIEIKLLSAQDELEKAESEIFGGIVQTIADKISVLQKNAIQLGILDALFSLAIVSYKNKYVRPGINREGIIDIKDGRHPVVEIIGDEGSFIPNDIFMDNKSSRMIIITGPNMSGKSTYIRQAAILSLMFQIGCFIPCKSANMCIVDRIFTRVGASDDLFSGQSTFMVEMTEVSNILRYATKNSLVILDEVGRGTSTLDGLSIAWAVVEYLADEKSMGCKTLFATHYHELTSLCESLDVVNLHVEVTNTINGVVFLHKIKHGSADKSYGIEVAKLAGLPEKVIMRSEELLEKLESESNLTNNKVLSKSSAKQKKSLSTNIPSNASNLFNYTEKHITQEIESMPIYDMTPVEVMNYVEKLQKEIRKK